MSKISAEITNKKNKNNNKVFLKTTEKDESEKKKKIVIKEVEKITKFIKKRKFKRKPFIHKKSQLVEEKKKYF